MHLRLGGCLYVIVGGVLNVFLLMDFLQFFSIHFLCLGKIFELLDEYLECYLCQFMTIFQQVIVVNVADLSELIIN